MSQKGGKGALRHAARLQPLSKNALKKLEKQKKAAEEKAAKAAAAAAKVFVSPSRAALHISVLKLDLGARSIIIGFCLDGVFPSLDLVNPCPFLIV